VHFSRAHGGARRLPGAVPPALGYATERRGALA
jgi:hypothetical protein